MKTRIILTTLAALLALAGCKRNHVETFDWGSHDRIEYAVDYTVSFAADHDSTMQVAATSNYGTARVVQRASENLLDADGRPVTNTFIILEDSIPMGKSITLSAGDLSYSGGEPAILHVQTVGSDDMVELRVLGSDTYTLYSIRDKYLYGPDESQTFTIGEGQHFTVALPVMTTARYPKTEENHTIRIIFNIL